ncbi:MAG: Flp family type IVb pilin [Firmicutes bacterium]|nr:Flp family type IVb pilin [Bacillota bacterium]
MLMRLWVWLQSLKQEREGQAMVEYALIIALVAVVVILALQFLGHSVNNAINNIANAVNSTTG